ncbi:hypothetical protein [Flavobacterium psychrophilum]|uniref:hypothetical protein n=1 Tax=Flavobacterium psychrophilum TaxID=96345 RepID=UPI003138700C
MSTLLEKIKSVKLCLMAHPDNEEHSEFADRISDLEEIENELSKDKWIKIEKDSDLPNKSGLFWIIEDGHIINEPCNYYKSTKRWVIQCNQFPTHYKPVIKPDLPPA